MNFKSVVVDVDGTAVDSPEQKEATSRLATAVRSLEGAGIKVCLATGRPLTFVRPVIDSMGISNPCIVAAGTKIVDPISSQELWQCAISKPALKELRAVLEYTDYHCLWDDFSENDYFNGRWNLRQLPVGENVSFIDICFVPEEKADEMVDQLSGIETIMVTSVASLRPNCRDVHVTDLKATKEHALYELESIIGVDKSEIIGVGDGLNDLHLFNAVGHKVAMKNAAPELQAAADEIIGHVKDDGLAEYFENLVKRSKDEI